MTSSVRPRAARVGRLGISLIEVLISIGVIGIGLLGVAALMPLASHSALQGLQEDRQAAAGQRAYREFQIREMGNPTNWVAQDDAQALMQPAVCIDPIGVSTTASTRFPANVNSPVSMPRLNLLSEPQRANGPPPQPMSLLQAREIFTVQDDLLLGDLPDDETLPPQPTWLDGTKRAAEGKYSWFATLVRELQPANAEPSDLYRLSIIVCYERLPQQDVLNERLVPTVNFLGGGFAGGDVQLVSSEPINTRAGDWLVLAQTTGSQLDFRWYRVILSDGREGQTERELTLHGPDWRVMGSASAILVPNVMAVYEKTVRLEVSSLWGSF